MAVQEEHESVSPRGLSARVLSLILGVWLFFSAFAWPHTPAQRTNAWIVGALVALVALTATVDLRTRYVQTVLAIWLAVSTWGMPTLLAGTVWNNLLVAVGLLVLSLLPSVPSHAGPGAAGQRRAMPMA
jgi:hypothetical protein